MANPTKDLVFAITLVIAFVLVLLLLGVVFYKFLFRPSESVLTVRPSVLRQEREKGVQKALSRQGSWLGKVLRRQHSSSRSILPSDTHTSAFQPMQERSDLVPVIVIIDHPPNAQAPPSYEDHRTSPLAQSQLAPIDTKPV